MPSRTSEVTYTDPRTGERYREIRIQGVPDGRTEYVRRRERADSYEKPETRVVVYQRSAEEDEDYENDQDYYYTHRREVRRERSVDDNRLRPIEHSRINDTSRRSSRRRNGSPPPDRDRSREGRKRRGHRRARSELPPERNQDQDRDLQSNDGSRNGFRDKYLDSSFDGIIAAVAGAAIGAMGVNRMLAKHDITEEENRANESKNRWKVVGGAVAGGLAFNAAENWFRGYLDTESEHPVKQGIQNVAERVDNLI